MGTYERKTREIQKSLHRRARMRRAYFKMIGEDPKTRKNEQAKKDIEDGKEINLSDASDSESEMSTERKGAKKETVKSEPKLTGRQLARRRRAEKYHKEKQKEQELSDARTRRIQHKNTMTKRTSKGQPRLGSQVGVLLDKIKKTEKN